MSIAYISLEEIKMLFDGDEKSKYQEQSVSIDKSKSSGTLILTNKRLVLERVVIEKHRLTKDKKIESILFSTSLTGITNVELVKKLIGKPVSFKVMYSGKETVFNVSDPKSWVDHVLNAKSEFGQANTGLQQQSMSQGQQQMSSQGVNVGQGVTVNLGYPFQASQPAPVSSTTEKTVVKIRCSSCKTLYDETIGNCPTCGNAN